ncbi:hypothetical protein C5468_10535 [Photorhabdus luminescens subsp. mexicana]|uniref:Uncharacterized protein n=1 Tax=Photorhabdus luminescens subsp. mexicana TaxID=2100167 RepID=A0A4R4JFK3_PHOLU|nr:hypothetical protein C5468_10535 [Photorhabdus luminescens subsp. mexicana]
MNDIRFNPAIGVANHFAFRFNSYLVVHQDNRFATVIFISDNQRMIFTYSDFVAAVECNLHRKTLSIEHFFIIFDQLRITIDIGIKGFTQINMIT